MHPILSSTCKRDNQEKGSHNALKRDSVKRIMVVIYRTSSKGMEPTHICWKEHLTGKIFQQKILLGGKVGKIKANDTPFYGLLTLGNGGGPSSFPGHLLLACIFHTPIHLSNSIKGKKVTLTADIRLFNHRVEDSHGIGCVFQYFTILHKVKQMQPLIFYSTTIYLAIGWCLASFE